MKISFKEIDKGRINEIFVDDKYIGIVIAEIWNNKWTMRPNFNHYISEDLIKKVKYDSFYKAGKALAKMYTDAFVFIDEENDTQEFDMRGIFKRRGP
tara:strand:- start:98 stop:388 length:291 start_codon:yes stop_codon:yes gene_type:complete